MQDQQEAYYKLAEVTGEEWFGQYTDNMDTNIEGDKLTLVFYEDSSEDFSHDPTTLIRTLNHEPNINLMKLRPAHYDEDRLSIIAEFLCRL